MTIISGLISIAPQMTTLSESVIIYIGFCFLLFPIDYEIEEDIENKTIEENQICHYSILKLVLVLLDSTFHSMMHQCIK